MRPPPLILMMLIVWSVFTATSFALGLTLGVEHHYLMVLSAIAIFWLGQHGGRAPRAMNFIWRLLLVIGLLFSIFAMFQHALMPNEIYGIPKPFHKGRLTGAFLSSNTTATFLGMIVIASLAQLYRWWRISYSKSHDSETKVVLDMIQTSVLAFTTFLFSFVALLLTASRAGVAATLCTCFLFILWVLSQFLFGKNKFGNFRMGPAVLFLIGVLAIFGMFWNMSGNIVGQRYETVFADMNSRADMFSASWKAFLHKPLFGHGLGSFNEAKLLGIDPSNNARVMAEDAAHNFLLQNLVQVGIVGLLILGGFYFTAIYQIVRGILQKQRYSTYLVAIFLMSMLVCFHGLFDYALEIPAIMLLHVWVLGVGYGLQTRYG